MEGSHFFSQLSPRDFNRFLLQLQLTTILRTVEGGGGKEGEKCTFTVIAADFTDVTDVNDVHSPLENMKVFFNDQRRLTKITVMINNKK